MPALRPSPCPLLSCFFQVPAASLEEVHKNPPPLKLWQKVAPLAIIFFGASFNLTILQVRRRPGDRALALAVPTTNRRCRLARAAATRMRTLACVGVWVQLGLTPPHLHCAAWRRLQLRTYT